MQLVAEISEIIRTAQREQARVIVALFTSGVPISLLAKTVEMPISAIRSILDAANLYDCARCGATDQPATCQFCGATRHA